MNSIFFFEFYYNKIYPFFSMADIKVSGMAEPPDQSQPGGADYDPTFLLADPDFQT